MVLWGFRVESQIGWRFFLVENPSLFLGGSDSLIESRFLVDEMEEFRLGLQFLARIDELRGEILGVLCRELVGDLYCVL